MFWYSTSGNLLETTDGTGAPQWDETFYPYGQQWNYANEAYSYWQFYGGFSRYQADLDLYLTPNRFYSSNLGRWMTPDPMGGNVLNPQSLNRYAYVDNNPASLTDPLGLKTCGRNGLKVPSGESALSWCKTHMGFSGGNSTAAFFSNPTDEFDLLGPTYVDNGEGGLMMAGITNGAQVANLLSPLRNGSFSGGSFSYQLGTLKLQTKVFVSTLCQNFLDEFKKGGCVNTFLKATGNALVPFTPSVGGGAASVLGATKFNAALEYAASRPNFLGGTGLIYPMKSSVFRSMLTDANTAAISGPLISLDLGLAQGVFSEFYNEATGGCQ